MRFCNFALAAFSATSVLALPSPAGLADGVLNQATNPVAGGKDATSLLGTGSNEDPEDVPGSQTNTADPTDTQKTSVPQENEDITNPVGHLGQLTTVVAEVDATVEVVVDVVAEIDILNDGELNADIGAKIDAQIKILINRLKILVKVFVGVFGTTGFPLIGDVELGLVANIFVSLLDIVATIDLKILALIELKAIVDIINPDIEIVIDLVGGICGPVEPLSSHAQDVQGADEDKKKIADASKNIMEKKENIHSKSNKQAATN